MNSRLVKYSVYTMMLIATVVFCTSCNKAPEETLKEIAQSAQKSCPHIMDEYTTMISVEALPNRSLKYTYLAKAELSEDEKKMAVVGMKNVLLDQLKKQPEIDFYQTHDVRFEHVFLDKAGQIVVLVNIEPTDYK